MKETTYNLGRKSCILPIRGGGGGWPGERKGAEVSQPERARRVPGGPGTGGGEQPAAEAFAGSEPQAEGVGAGTDLGSCSGKPVQADARETRRGRQTGGGQVRGGQVRGQSDSAGKWLGRPGRGWGREDVGYLGAPTPPAPALPPPRPAPRPRQPEAPRSVLGCAHTATLPPLSGGAPPLAGPLVAPAAHWDVPQP